MGVPLPGPTHSRKDGTRIYVTPPPPLRFAERAPRRISPWQRWLSGIALALLLWVALDLAYVSIGAETDQAQVADVIVVLGCNIEGDNGQPGECIQARAGQAALLYHHGLAPWIIASGGGGKERRTEAAVLTRVLIAAGVPAAAILAEDQSRDTIQNLRNSQALMTTHGWHTALLVTEPYHIKRATLIAHDLGVTVYPSPARASPLWTQPARRLLKLSEDTGSLMLYQLKRLAGVQT